MFFFLWHTSLLMWQHHFPSKEGRKCKAQQFSFFFCTIDTAVDFWLPKGWEHESLEISLSVSQVECIQSQVLEELKSLESSENQASFLEDQNGFCRTVSHGDWIMQCISLLDQKYIPGKKKWKNNPPVSAFSFHMHTLFPWKHITKLWKGFQVFSYSSRLGIVPISERSILPGSGNEKKIVCSRRSLCLFDLKAIELMLFCVI